MPTKPKVAFIGLGAMGMGMALHLLDDGFIVSGYDVNRKALQILEEKGGFAASSPRDCATDASFLVCMVANAAQTEDVLFTESTGAVFGLPSNATMILCSTVPPSFPGKLLGKFHVDFARPDVQLVDCPVSGGTVRAAQGTLTILCSGSSEALAAAKPILDSMAETKYEIDGGLGSANKVKLVNQHLAGIHIAAAAEAMGLVASLGLNTRAFHDAVLGSAATSWMFENRAPHMLNDDWTPHSALAIFVKDMGIVTTEGLVLTVPLWLASSAEQLYLLGAQMGYDRDDDSGVVRVFHSKSPSLVSSAAAAATGPDDSRTFQLIKSLLEIVHTVAAIEALALGISLGLSACELVSIISNAAGASEAFKRVSSRIVAGDFTSGPSISETRSTLGEIVLLAKKLSYPLHLTVTALNLYDLAVIGGLGARGNAALLKLWSAPSPLGSGGARERARYKTIPKTETLRSLPDFAHSTTNLVNQIQAHLNKTDCKLVILDDDPTGTQTCHDINVLTMCDVDLLVTEFQSQSKGFFILTNSRALPPDEARNLVSEILRNVAQAASKANQKFEVVLRSDSTLRGHFLEEVESHISTIASPDAWIFAPFFEPGGRFTIDDVHYVAENDSLIPAADTPFASDRTFGYKSSNLRDYVLEKAGTRFTQTDIVSVTLNDIRQGGQDAISAKLTAVPKGGVVIMNAVKEEDMLLFCLALLSVQKKHGLRFGYRTGASFVSSRLGIPRKGPIQARQLQLPEAAIQTGGLIVAGSYVPQSSRQLEALIRRRGAELEVLTVDVPALLAEARHRSDVQATLQSSVALQGIIERASTTLQAGKDILVVTSRELMTTDTVANTGDSPASVQQLTNLDINALVASSLVHILRSLQIRPRYLLAKGGVTSSDAATAGVGIKRGRVLGQAAPGVPVWWCENEDGAKAVEEGGRSEKWIRLPLIVFPGNVGDEETLADVVEKWAA